jgi:hypothetical protein
MGNLVYLTNGCLDLLTEGEHGSLDPSAPSDDLFVHPTNLIRPLGPHLYGWQVYEGMAPWQTSPELATDLTAESACIWKAASRGTSR